MSVSVDHAQARKALGDAWEKIDDLTVVAPSAVVPHLETVILASDVTYKYILVTGILAKCVNPSVHPRALQVASTLQHSFDARSLCHDVVVNFEKAHGDLWGRSNEPYLNKPARHPEHDQTNPQLKNKRVAITVHQALEFAHNAPAPNAFAMLVHLLRLSKQRSETLPVATSQVETSYRRVVDFVQQFLATSDGGTHLVAVVGAFVALLNEGFDVRVYPPNVPDKFANTAGDIEIRQDKLLVSAYESKQRPINLDDVRHGVSKAKRAGVLEYCFVYSAGLAPGQEAAIQEEVLHEGENLDVLLLDVHDAYEEWAVALGPIRRAKFGITVVNLLRDDMHRSEVAGQAAELWNSRE